MPLTRMKAENNTPMAVSPTPKACLIWSLLPRTMYWSTPSIISVKPMTHMGQLETEISRGAAAAPPLSGSPWSAPPR